MSRRVELMTVPSFLTLLPQLPLSTASIPPSPTQLFPFQLHPSLPIPFHSITFSISCHIIQRNMEYGHSISGNSVVVQFNFCISFHFFLALHPEHKFNPATWPRNKLSDSAIYPFSFLCNKLGLTIYVFPPSL